MTDHSTQPIRNRPQILSTVLFLAAIGFAAAAVYIWYIDDSGSNEEPPAPTVASGMYSLVNVLTAFEDADLDGDYGRTTARTEEIGGPGQLLTIEGESVYIFIFSGGDPAAVIAEREAAFAAVNPATMTLTTPSGNDVTNGEPVSAYQGANVIAVLVGGDDALKAEVQQVIEGLS